MCAFCAIGTESVVSISISMKGVYPISWLSKNMLSYPYHIWSHFFLHFFYILTYIFTSAEEHKTADFSSVIGS